MKKNIFSCTLLLSLCIFLSSCGGNSDTQANEVDSVDTEINQNSHTDNENDDTGIKKITFEIFADSGTIELAKGEEGSPVASFREQTLVITEVPSQTNLEAIQSILQEKQNYSGDAKVALAKKKKEYFASYIDANSEEVMGMSADWEQNKSVEVVYNDNYFTTIGFYLDEYGGGAHGYSSISYMILDLKSSKQVLLSDIFDEQGLASLKSKLQDKALKLAQKEGATSLEDYGFFDAEIELTKTFMLTKKGLEFEYQQGEIAPRVMAPPSFLFEWNEIKDIIKSDSPVRSLIN
jgi:hypothetical protein